MKFGYYFCSYSAFEMFLYSYLVLVFNLISLTRHSEAETCKMNKIVKSVHRSYMEEKYSKLIFSFPVMILMLYSILRIALRAPDDKLDTSI